MSPYLTDAGKWILATGIAFLLTGVIASNPMILLMGEVAIVLIGLSMFLSVPGATAIDRRLISVETFEDDGSAAGGHLVGDEIELEVRIHNASGIALHNFEAQPFTSHGLIPKKSADCALIPRGGAATSATLLRGVRPGRWTLHGFDVSVRDPLGLVETRDYLPATRSFEFYPKAGRMRGRKRRLMAGQQVRTVGQHVEDAMGAGTELRELRDYQSGDSLRDIAWKPTLRMGKLVARENEREVRSSTYVFLDISSSMRGGQWEGQKLDHAVSLAVDLVEQVLSKRDRVGLITFDEKLYGHIEPGSTPRHFKRILHHLVGLSSVVDGDLTEMDDADVERLAADYLLVQERLDFRKGRHVDSVSGVNTRLMHRWLKGVAQKTEQEFASGSLSEGIVAPTADPIRRFLQLRGVEIPYRVEARLGLKEKGLTEAIEHMVKVAREPQRVVIISDLCGMMALDSVLKAARLAMSKRHRFRFEFMFTPDYFQPEDPDDFKAVVAELFTIAERTDRERIVTKIRSAGIRVDRVIPRRSGGLAPKENVE